MTSTRPTPCARHLQLRASALAVGLALLAWGPTPASAAVWIGGSGSWTTGANWLGGAYPNSALEAVYIDDGLAVNSAATLAGSVSIARLYIDAGDALVISGSSGALSVSGGQVVNNGELTIRSGGSLSLQDGQFVNNGTLTLTTTNISNNSVLSLGADATLGGTGTTVLTTTNGRTGYITAGGHTLTLAVDHTVTGNGTIAGAVVNLGKVVADGSSMLTLAPGSGKTFDNGVGLIQVTDGSRLVLGAGTLGGGSLQGLGQARLTGDSAGSIFRDLALTGAFTFYGSGTFRGVTIADSLSVAGGATLYASGTLINNGVLALASDGANSSLVLAADTTLSGAGTTRLTSTGGLNGRINAGNYTLTIGNGHTVSGDTSITGAVINQGQVIADGSKALTLAPGSGHSFDNRAGLIQLTDGSALSLSTGTLDGGALQSLGQARLSSASSGSVFAGVTLGGSFTVAGSTAIYVAGTLTNNGTLTLASTNIGSNSVLALGADTTLGGTGTTVLTTTNGRTGYITAGGHTLTLAAGQTVSGTGTIAGAVVNLGQVVANGSSTLTLAPGSGKTFDNGAGLIQVTDGSRLVLGNGTLGGGSLQGLGQARLSSAGAGSVLRDITLLGSFGLAPGNSLYANGALTNNGTLTLASDFANGGSALVLSANTTLAGTGSTLLSAYNGTYYGQVNANSHLLTIASGHTVGGTGRLIGTAVNHGTLAPGVGIGRLNVVGTLSLAGDALLRIDAAGLIQTTQYDLLAITGDVDLGGTVLFDFGSFNAQVGNSFTFLTFTGSSSGTFDLAQAAGYQLGLSYGAHAVTATVTGITPVPEPQPWSLLLGGLAATGVLARRRQAKT